MTVKCVDDERYTYCAAARIFLDTLKRKNIENNIFSFEGI